MNKEAIEAVLSGIGKLDMKGEDAGVFSVQVAAALGVIPATCIFDGFDPEDGRATYTSPEYIAWNKQQEVEFAASGTLLEMTEEIGAGFGSVPCYPQDIEGAVAISTKLGFGPSWEFVITLRVNNGDYLQEVSFFDTELQSNPNKDNTFYSQTAGTAVCGAIMHEVIRRGA